MFKAASLRLSAVEVFGMARGAWLLKARRGLTTNHGPHTSQEVVGQRRAARSAGIPRGIRKYRAAGDVTLLAGPTSGCELGFSILFPATRADRVLSW